MMRWVESRQQSWQQRLSRESASAQCASDPLEAMARSGDVEQQKIQFGVWPKNDTMRFDEESGSD